MIIFTTIMRKKGEPYPNPVSYTDVSDLMKNVNDKNVQDIIYLVGLHEIGKGDNGCGTFWRGG